MTNEGLEIERRYHCKIYDPSFHLSQ